MSRSNSVRMHVATTCDTAERPSPCSGGDGVLVVQSAEQGPGAYGLRCHRQRRWQATDTRRRLHLQPAMRPAKVVANVVTHDAFGVEIVEDDVFVETLSKVGPNHPFK